MMNAQRPGFACPIHKVGIGSDFFCPQCGVNYPSVNGIPILINEANSVFDIASYTSAETAYGGASSYAGHLDRRTGIRQIYRSLMHRLSESNPVPHEFDVEKAIGYINQHCSNAQILVVGAGDTTYVGNITYSDVALGRNTSCIADAHDLPFEDATFDACIVVAVLEHVADPQRCVAELVRVLRPSGYVYSETPFLQPVHMGAYDFTRFTYLGHRRLFRLFDEIQSGMAGGPATSLAQVFRYLLVALTERPFLRKLLKMIGLLITYPVRQLDRATKNSHAAYDSASGFYFFGSLRTEPISDREILKSYRGG